MNGRVSKYLPDLFVILLLAALPLGAVHPELLSSPNTAAGGDTASQIFYAKLLAEEILPQGRITAWVPEVFGGLPFLSYYFPLPFLVIAALSKFITFTVAFKWGSMLGLLALPGAAYLAGRLLGFGRVAAAVAGGFAAAFLMHESNSIWGGNILSTLAGEFAYSYGTVLTVITMAVWSRGISDEKPGRYWVLGGCLEALVGMCHGYALLVTGFSTLFFLLEPGRFRRNALYFVKSHSLAFFLLGFWLWPLIEMGPYINANDASYFINNFDEILPVTLRPVFILGAISIAAAFMLRKSASIWNAAQTRHAAYFVFAAAMAALGWFGAERAGLADIRFFPYVWLTLSIVMGWATGLLIESFDVKPARVGAAAGILLMLLGFLGLTVKSAFDWSLWNHSGIEAKSMWPVYSALFPHIRGNLNSPRLVFEHDPANDDLGSTRTLEALPMHIGGRPVLEGLYMESAILGPAIYQTQAELSERPSSPLSNFPSGSLAPSRAALHMDILHANEVLARSERAKAEIEKSGLFTRVADVPPFAVFRLKQMNSNYVDVVGGTIKVETRERWKEKSFSAFNKVERWNDPPTVYLKPGETPQWKAVSASTDNAVSNFRIERHRISFDTKTPGAPHLLRFAYHPRWQAADGSPIYLATPGFMLVAPKSGHVELVYGETPAMVWGQRGTIIALMAAVAFGIVLPRIRKGEALQPDYSRPEISGREAAHWIAAALVIASASAALHFTSYERRHSRAFKEFTANRYADAAADFDGVWEHRKSRADREDSLFWAARNWDLAGEKGKAIERYTRLVTEYDGRWVPESLYRLADIYTSAGRYIEAADVVRRLHAEYPENDWSRKTELVPVDKAN